MTRAMEIFAAALVLGFAWPALAGPCASVEREMTYGRVALQDARNRQGFLESARQFEAAAAKAPKCAKARFNLGVVYEKARAYRKALAAFQAYLRLAPGASDAKAVRTKIYELEYRAKRAKLRRRTAKTRKAKPRNLPTPKQKALNLTGRWRSIGKGNNRTDYQVKTAGNSIEIIKIRWWHPKLGRWIKSTVLQTQYRGTIIGRKLRGTVITDWRAYGEGQSVTRNLFTGTIGQNGSKISISYYQCHAIIKCGNVNLTMLKTK